MPKPQQERLPTAQELAELDAAERNALLLGALRGGEFDFLDLGTHRGAGLALGRRLGGTKGLGVETHPDKCLSLLRLGHFVLRADVTKMPELDRVVDFAVCSHILVHLQDRQALRLVLERLGRMCRKFIYIEQPSFSSEARLRGLGLKLTHSTLDAHTCRITIEELASVLRELQLVPFALAEAYPILDSQDGWVHRLDAPPNRGKWDPATDPPRPPVLFDPPVYRDVVAVIATGDADVEDVLARRRIDLRRVQPSSVLGRGQAPVPTGRVTTSRGPLAASASGAPPLADPPPSATSADPSPPYPFTRAGLARRAFIAEHLSHGAELRILEIGAFDNPTFVRPESNVQYADWWTKRQLVAQHGKNPRRRPQLAVDVDHLLKGRPLSKAVRRTFDLVVANHVIVRVPDLIGWLIDLARVVAPGGHAFFTIPDRRYTFDVDRTETDVVELLRCHDEGLTTPSYYQLLRDLYYHRSVKMEEVLAGRDTPHPRPRRLTLGEAMDKAEALVKTDHGPHCHVFTSESFRTVWQDLATTGLVPWIDVEIGETPRGQNEFPVLLRRTDVEVG